MNADQLEKVFSFQRAALLVRNRILDDAPAFLIGAACIFGFKLLALLMDFNGGHDVSAAQNAWPIFIALGGLLLAGRAFERMHDGRGGSEWVLLPATSLEKYSAAFVFYLGLFPLAATAAAVAISAAIALFGLLLGVSGARVWIPVQMLNWGQATTYFLFAATALAGSARFRKLSLVKTAVICFAWAILLGGLWLFLVGTFTDVGRSLVFHRGRVAMQNIVLSADREALLSVVFAAFRFISFIAAVLYGYFAVAEKESVDEVQ